MDRCILILDDAEGHLGPIALQLIRRGLDIYYCQDPDEACLLGHQEGQRTHACLFSVKIDLDSVRTVRERLSSLTQIGGAYLAAVGPRPDDETRATLSEMGINWALWEPFGEDDVLYVAQQMLARQGDPNARIEDRVAAGLDGLLHHDGNASPVRIADISTSGAYLANSLLPCDKGSEIVLEIDLPDGPISVNAIVAREEADDNDPLLSVGVTFTAVSEEQRARLTDFIIRKAQLYTV